MVLPGVACRFGFGKEGKPCTPRGFVKNRKTRVYTNGAVELDGRRYDPGGSGANDPAEVLKTKYFALNRLVSLGSWERVLKQKTTTLASR